MYPLLRCASPPSRTEQYCKTSIWLYLSSSKLCNVSLHGSIIIYFSSNFLNGHLDLHSIIISRSNNYTLKWTWILTYISSTSLPAYSNIIKINVLLESLRGKKYPNLSKVNCRMVMLKKVKKRRKKRRRRGEEKKKKKKEKGG